jgi:hypothetical protein
MSVFYRQAYEAACRGVLPPGLSDEHFESWKSLNEALLWLPTDEQRSDAIYGDWLMQLNTPGWAERLTVKGLLIGNGALAANYLAELAQNANDASEGEEAEVRIVLSGHWLVFCNNGRKVTPDNQLGLCRFFKHVDPQKTADQVIGQFGVGFKSSFRIADEVFVRSWEGESRFAFRLPISTADRPSSWPDQATQQRVVRQLAEVGVRVAAHALDPSNAGFCTPEALQRLPQDAETILAGLHRDRRGTAFCFRLHPTGLTEVTGRIQGQRRELNELSPLFLPFLRTVQIGPNELHMSVGRHSTDDDLPGLVCADRITLTTRSNNGGNASRSCFWRLKGVLAEDRWQVALHASSDFRLRKDRDPEEHGVSVREGAAYAFFPLSDVVWPFRIHLHLDIKTNLARGDWNPSEEPKVREQIRRAIAGTLRWIERFKSRHHADWRVEELIEPGGDLKAVWANFALERLREELRELPLMKTLWGSYCTSRDARTVKLIDGNPAKKNWVEFCAKVTSLGQEFLLVNALDGFDFGVPELPAQKLKDFFLRAAEQGGADSDFWRKFVTAAICAESLEPDALMAVLRKTPVECPDGTSIALENLFLQPAGATLSQEWHDQFQKLAVLLNDKQRGQHSVGRRGLRDQMLKLAKPIFNPSWSELPGRMQLVESWSHESQGDLFWKTDRIPCPPSLGRAAIQVMRVMDGSKTWRQITEVWLEDSEAPQCFHGVVKSWRLGPTISNRRLNEVREMLKGWDLWEAWQEAVENRIREGLGAKLGRELVKHSETRPGMFMAHGPFEDLLDSGHVISTSRLNIRWQAVVKDAEVAAFRMVLQARGAELRAKKLLARNIDPGLRNILTLWGEYGACPWWLTRRALEMLVSAGVWNPEQYSLLSADSLNVDRRREMAGELLAHYYKWAERELTPTDIEAIQRLCDAEPRTLRGNWSVGLSVHRCEFVRNLLNPEAAGPNSEDPSLNASLLKLDSVRWHGVQTLPPVLRQVPAVAQAALQVAVLELKLEMPGALIPAARDELEPELLTDPLFARFETAAKGGYAAATQPVDLEWWRGEQLVADLRKAPFVLWNGRLVTHRVLRPADESQYNLVLANYGNAHREDAEFHAAYDDRSRPRSEVYESFRKRIVANARKQNVDAAGYRVGHVLRELLQNAESAYASKGGEVPQQRDFVVTLAPLSGGSSWQVLCRHHGRSFNESDVQGTVRKDIDRIVSTPNEDRPITRDEVGRFNRGFKSVFLVTDAVTITSGRFKFSIRDLLLLHPPPPVPPRSAMANYTEFAFSCTRDKVFKLVELAATDESNQQRALPIFTPSSFVFLRHVALIRVQLADRLWQWTLRRGLEAKGWVSVEIAQSFPPSAHRFLVFANETVPVDAEQESHRYAAALRVDEAGVPAELDRAWGKIHLTFPTEDEFPLGFLVNGDFLTDAGRQGIQLNAAANLRLIAASYSAVVDRMADETGVDWTKAKWLGWAKILRLRHARGVLSDRFPMHHEGLLREAERAEGVLVDHVPHGDAVSRVAVLEFPSRLMRRLAPLFAAGWGVNTAAWIDADVEAQLPPESRPTVNDVSLDDFIGSLGDDNPLRSRIRADLDSPAVRDLRLDAVERRELERALHRLAAVVFVPVLGQPSWHNEPEPRTARWLWDWWEPKCHLAAEYTLDGANLPLVCPSPGATSDDLVRDLRSPGSDAGKRAWYRLLGLACLLSAAYGNMTRLRRFWREELEVRGFWEATSGQDFPETTRRLFGRLVEREFTDVQASGEDAEYWRHVFYDVRKVHELIWQQEFAETVLQLAADPSRSAGLIEFLRSGMLAGQRPWAGVLGQSAGSPLFFVGRELRRLNIIPHADFDPSAFFPCAPVRRAAQQIGWIDRRLAQRSDFASLAEISEQIFLKITRDEASEPRLLPYYDIPLLHLGLNG